MTFKEKFMEYLPFLIIICILGFAAGSFHGSKDYWENNYYELYSDHKEIVSHYEETHTHNVVWEKHITNYTISNVVLTVNNVTRNFDVFDYGVMTSFDGLILSHNTTWLSYHNTITSTKLIDQTLNIKIQSDMSCIGIYEKTEN